MATAYVDQVVVKFFSLLNLVFIPQESAVMAFLSATDISLRELRTAVFLKLAYPSFFFFFFLNHLIHKSA
jgi:hypothetical protein